MIAKSPNELRLSPATRLFEMHTSSLTDVSYNLIISGFAPHCSLGPAYCPNLAKGSTLSISPINVNCRRNLITVDNIDDREGKEC